MKKWVLLLIVCFWTSKGGSQDGNSSTLHNIPLYSDSITVYFFMSDECNICKDYAPYINQLYDKFSNPRITFVGVFPNFASKKPNIQKFKEKYHFQFDMKTDYFKKTVHKFDAKVTPEVVIYDEKHELVLYQGRIDNKYYGLGKRRRVITAHELADALSSIEGNQEIIEKTTVSIGCFINLTDKLMN